MPLILDNFFTKLLQTKKTEKIVQVTAYKVLNNRSFEIIEVEIFSSLLLYFSMVGLFIQNLKKKEIKFLKICSKGRDGQVFDIRWFYFF